MAIIVDGQLQKFTGTRSHPPDDPTALMHIHKHTAIQIARQQPLLPMKRVYEQAFSNIDLEDEQAVVHLSSLKSLKSTLYQSKAKRLPNLPHTRANIVLEGEWASMHRQP